MNLYRRGDTALHWAAFKGDLGAVEAMLAFGANVVRQGDLINICTALIQQCLRSAREPLYTHFTALFEQQSHPGLQGSDAVLRHACSRP